MDDSYGCSKKAKIVGENYHHSNSFKSVREKLSCVNEKIGEFHQRKLGYKNSVLNEDTAVILGISIPVVRSEESELLTNAHSDVSLDCNQLTDLSIDSLYFSKLPASLDPNLGIMGKLPSSNIPYERSTYNAWNIEPHFLHILPSSSPSLNESSILIFGGLNPSSILMKKPLCFDNDDFVLGSTILQYLLNSGMWKYYGTMIEPRCYHACALDGQYVYITGGYSLLKREHGEMLAISSVDRLDLRGGRWKNCADMIIQRAAHALVSHKGYLYAFGGRNSQGNILASVEKYYPDQDIWLEITTLPQPTMGLSATCIMDTIWLAGGITDNNYLDPSGCLLSSVFSFTPSNEKWHTEEPLPHACAFSSCISNDFSIWLVGGSTISKKSKEDTLVSSSTVLKFSLSEKPSKWKSVASLLYPRHAVATVLYDECIYVLAGIESANMCASDKMEVINSVGNVNILCSKIPVPVTGCTSVLLLQEAGDYRYTNEASNISPVTLERKNYLCDIERCYSSETSGMLGEISEEDRNKNLLCISDESYSETESSKETFFEGTNKIKDSGAHKDTRKSIMKQSAFGENQIPSHYSETVERQDETSQSVMYRASMEIFLSSSEISSNALKQNKSSASKWLNFLQKLSTSDEKLHKEIFQSKEPKMSVKTEIGDTKFQENYKSTEVMYFEKFKGSMTEHENLANLSSISEQNPAPSDQQSFMYVQSNIKSQSVDLDSKINDLDHENNDKSLEESVSSSKTTELEMDNFPLISPDTATITIDENAFPVILLMGGEYSRKTDKSRFILSYYCNENTWKCAGYMPEYRCHHCAIFLNNKIYIIGGFDSENSKLYENITNKTLYYDICERTWHDAAGMNYSRAHHSAVVFKDRIYVLGGRNELGNILSSVEMYSETNNEWKKCEPLPYPILGAAATFSNDTLYIFGGITYEEENEVIASKIAVLNHERSSSSVGPEMIIPLAFCGIACFSNSAWLFGGLKEEEGNLVSSKDIFKFDLLTETWSKVAELSGPRFASVTVSIGNEVYIIGGHSTQDKNEVLNCEKIDLLKNELSAREPLPIAVSAKAGIMLREVNDTKKS